MADDGVIKLMLAWKRAMLRDEARQMREMARRWLAVEERLKADIELLAREAAEMETLTEAQLFRLERYKKLQQQVRVEWSNYAAWAADLIETKQGELAEIGVEHAAEAISTIGQGIIGSFNVLSVAPAELMIGLLGDGSPLLATLTARSVSAEMVGRMAATLLQGTALGWNPRKTARQMADGLAGGLNKALTIARTEQMRVYREANRQQMQESGVVGGYYRIATRDDRVCSSCLALDGEFYELGEVMPEHPNGRCGQVPRVNGVQPPQWQRGPDWFREQDAATQEKILGPQRFALYRDGQIGLGDTVRIRRDGVWGRSTQVRPVAELAGG